MKATTNPGAFRKGHDERRHEFTREECRKGGVIGYQRATESLLRRYPGCDPHFLMCAIVGAKRWYELPQVQSLTGQETSVELFATFAR